MVSKEATVYLRSAEGQLTDAEVALENGRFALSVFSSAMASENATASLILTLGAKPSKRHKNSLILYRMAKLRPDLREDLERLIRLLKALEPEVTKARYPVRKGLDLIPPSDLYNEGQAQEALGKAKSALRISRRLLKVGALA